VNWATEQAGHLTHRIMSWANNLLGYPVKNETQDVGSEAVVLSKHGSETRSIGEPVRPMTETEMQSTGCIAGALAGFGASMASSPMEVAMLSSGATTIVSSTPLLGLGLFATIVGAGCGIGSFISIPIVTLVGHISEPGIDMESHKRLL
jgi:hypothetical protein